jgi:hypothetical protein
MAQSELDRYVSARIRSSLESNKMRVEMKYRASVEKQGKPDADVKKQEDLISQIATGYIESLSSFVRACLSC